MIFAKIKKHTTPADTNTPKTAKSLHQNQQNIGHHFCKSEILRILCMQLFSLWKKTPKIGIKHKGGYFEECAHCSFSSFKILAVNHTKHKMHIFWQKINNQAKTG